MQSVFIHLLILLIQLVLQAFILNFGQLFDVCHFFLVGLIIRRLQLLLELLHLLNLQLHEFLHAVITCLNRLGNDVFHIHLLIHLDLSCRRNF